MPHPRPGRDMVGTGPITASWLRLYHLHKLLSLLGTNGRLEQQIENEDGLRGGERRRRGREAADRALPNN